MKSNGIIEISGPNIPKIDTLPITIYLSSLLNFGVTAGDPWPAGGSADMKSIVIIEISGPNNPKIATHNDTSVISFEFWSDGGRRVILSRRADMKSNGFIEISGK